jgi:DNA-binding MarR family transcriptional regulator
MRVLAPSDPNADPSLSAALRISVMRLSRRMRQERDDVGLSATHLAALATLERHGPIPLGELAAREKVAPPSMTRVVSRLATAGLVDRQVRPGDRRQVLVTITDQGRALLAADRRRRDEWLSARLAELPRADTEALHRVIPILERLAGS